MIWILLGLNLLILLAGTIVWRGFYRRHKLYHLEGTDLDAIIQPMSHHKLFVLFFLHLLLIMFLSSSLLWYVW